MKEMTRNSILLGTFLGLAAFIGVCGAAYSYAKRRSSASGREEEQQDQEGPGVGDAVPAPPPTLNVEQMLEDCWQRENDIALMAEEDKGARPRTSRYDSESRWGSPRRTLHDQRLALHTAAFYFHSAAALRAVLASNAAQIGHRLDKFHSILLRQPAAPGAASVVDVPTPEFRVLESNNMGGGVQTQAETPAAAATQTNTSMLPRPTLHRTTRVNDCPTREYPLGLLCRRKEAVPEFDEMFQVLLKASKRSAIIITDALLVCVTEIMFRALGFRSQAIDVSDGVVAMMMGRIDRLLQANSRAGRADEQRSAFSLFPPSGVWWRLFVPGMWTVHPSIYRPLLQRFLDRDLQAVSSHTIGVERNTLLQAAVTMGNADITQIVADRCSPAAVTARESIYTSGGNCLHLALAHSSYSPDTLAKMVVLCRLCPAAAEMPCQFDGQLPLHVLCGMSVFKQTKLAVERPHLYVNRPRFELADACACLDLLVGLYPGGALVRDKAGKTPFNLLPLNLDSYPRLLLCIDEYLCPPEPREPPKELHPDRTPEGSVLDESDEEMIASFIAGLENSFIEGLEKTHPASPSLLSRQPKREIDFGARRVALWLAVVARTPDKQPTLLRRLRRSGCLVQVLLFL